MTEPDDSLQQQDLPLPSPRSPAALDDRILAYARDQAPQPMTRRQPWWVAGAATAVIAVVAVMITVPRNPAPTELSPASADFAEARKMGAAQQPAEAERETAPDSALEMADQADSGLLQETRADRSAAAVGAPLAPASPARQKTASGAALSSMVQAELQADQLASQLQELAQLLEQGDEDRARTGYEQLRQSCPSCALPESLEQALTRHRARPNP